eukprot:scaffold3124_cov390-Prasinococcus_capsulatus_cf.AAC.1
MSADPTIVGAHPAPVGAHGRAWALEEVGQGSPRARRTPTPQRQAGRAVDDDDDAGSADDDGWSRGGEDSVRRTAHAKSSGQGGERSGQQATGPKGAHAHALHPSIARTAAAAVRRRPGRAAAHYTTLTTGPGRGRGGGGGGVASASSVVGPPPSLLRGALPTPPPAGHGHGASGVRWEAAVRRR